MSRTGYSGKPGYSGKFSVTEPFHYIQVRLYLVAFDIIDHIVKQRKLLEIFIFLIFYEKYGLRNVEFLVTKM